MSNQNFILGEIKTLLRQSHADFICLQEVVGDHLENDELKKSWPTNAQFEYLADEVWPHFSYGKNAVYEEGHHGNAILSKFPIVHFDNLDLTLHKFEQRGMLHMVVDVEGKHLHLLTTHINLLEMDRMRQVAKIINYIKEKIPKKDPLILCGDFNDWPKNLSLVFYKQLGFDEAFLSLNRTHAKTFPCFFPLLSLDRIYGKNLTFTEAQVLKPVQHTKLSDHLPLQACFNLI